MPQSQKSGLLATLWLNEPLKAQWAVMASAYTTLRDNFELPNTTLRDFTTRVTPWFGIPVAGQYVSLLGYVITPAVQPNGDPSFDLIQLQPSRVDTLNLIPVSVDNIIQSYTVMPGVVKKAGSLWPLPLEKNSALAISHRHNMESLRANTIPDPASAPDPYAWMHENPADTDEFDLSDIYSQPDPNMDPEEDLIYEPSLEDMIRARTEMVQSALDDQHGNGFPHWH